jgi:hypothetical protein
VNEEGNNTGRQSTSLKDGEKKTRVRPVDQNRSLEAVSMARRLAIYFGFVAASSTDLDPAGDNVLSSQVKHHLPGEAHMFGRLGAEEICKMDAELASGGWLTHGTINAILQRLLPPTLILCDAPNVPLLDDLSNWRVTRPSSRLGNTCRYVIPLNVSRHWIVAHLDVRGNEILILDSLRGAVPGADEVVQKWASAFISSRCSSESQSHTLHYLALPQQTDGYNCGLFAIIYLFNLAIHHEQVDPSTFSISAFDPDLWRHLLRNYWAYDDDSLGVVDANNRTWVTKKLSTWPVSHTTASKCKGENVACQYLRQRYEATLTLENETRKAVTLSRSLRDCAQQALSVSEDRRNISPAHISELSKLLQDIQTAQNTALDEGYCNSAIWCTELACQVDAAIRKYERDSQRDYQRAISVFYETERLVKLAVSLSKPVNEAMMEATTRYEPSTISSHA